MGPFRVASAAVGAPLPSLPHGAQPLPADPSQAVGIMWTLASRLQMVLL